MSTESFLAFAKRVTRAGILDLTSVIEFADTAESHWRDVQGKDWSGPWWRKVNPTPKGKGLVPRRMKHPRTGEWFVFPMLTVTRDRGELVVATVVEPRCPRCGSDMERRQRADGNGDIFGCVSYPKCRASIPAFADVTGSGVQIDKPDPVEVVAPKTSIDVERLRARVLWIVDQARKVVEDHPTIGLPIGYRTVAHLVDLAVIFDGNADEAWRVWVSGRVSKQERDRFDFAGLPSGDFTPIKGSGDNPSWYATLKKIVDAGLPVMIVGGAGSGKTRFAKWYAEQANKRLRIVVGSADVAGSQLWVARRDAKAGTVTTIAGPAALALTQGEVLLLDEVDAFDPNSLLPLNAPLNGDNEVSVPVLGDLKLSKEARIIAAANTNGRSKNSRVYAGRNRLDGAFLNRFAAVVMTNYEAKVDSRVCDEIFAKLGLI